MLCAGGMGVAPNFTSCSTTDQPEYPFFDQRAEECRKINVALADHGEYFVFDGFLKSPFILASLLPALLRRSL